MPRKESNAVVKHIPTKSEVKESTNKMTRAISFSEKEPLKVAREIEKDTSREVVIDSTLGKKKKDIRNPSGEAKVFETIAIFKDTNAQ